MPEATKKKNCSETSVPSGGQQAGPSLRAGSRAASRFTSTPDKGQIIGLFSEEIFYENLLGTGVLSCEQLCCLVVRAGSSP
jgi:hypothetical protein